MRVIRPARLHDGRRRNVLSAMAMTLVGTAAAILLAFVPSSSPGAAAVLGVAAALGLGMGGAHVLRAMQHSPQRRLTDELAALLSASFDDSYALVIQPRLPEVPGDMVALLVGPAAVRSLVVRDWDGRYRVRGRTWEFDARGRRGWIACRTNPSFEAARANDAVLRWARAADLPSQLHVAPAVVFPRRHSRIVLEDPDDEIVTADNAPWWAQRIGKAQRLDAGEVARVVDAVMRDSERMHQRAVHHPPTTVRTS